MKRMMRYLGPSVVAMLATVTGGAVIPDARGATPGGPVVDIYPGQNAQAIVDSYPTGQDFRLKAGTHQNFSVRVKKGNGFYGEPGTILDGGGSVDHAFYHTGSGYRPDDVTIEGQDKNNRMVVRNYDNGQQRQMGTFAPRGALRWTLRSLDVSGAYAYGVHLGHYMVVEDSLIHDNGILGIGGVCSYCRIEGNTVRHNNLGGRGQLYDEAGGIKIAYAYGVAIRGNTVHDNNGAGIWVDLNSRRINIEGNWVYYHALAAIWYEVSFDGSILDNKVEHSQRQAPNDTFLYGNIQVDDSVNVTVARNTSWTAVRDHIAVRDTGRTDAGGRTNKVYVYGNYSYGNENGYGRTGAIKVGTIGDEFWNRELRFQDNRYERVRSFSWWNNTNLSFSQWQGYRHDLSGSSV